MKKDPVYALADLIVKEIVEEVLTKNKKTQKPHRQNLTPINDKSVLV